MHVTIYSIKESKAQANKSISTELLNDLCNRYDEFDYVDIMEPKMGQSEVQQLLEYMQLYGCKVDYDNKCFAFNERARQQLCDGEQHLFFCDGEVWSTKQLIESWDDESARQTWYVGVCLNAKV